MDAETPEARQARQRAYVKWILSKAFNNRVPDNLRDPFYRDNENHERLKPQIIVEMGNATLYCQTLSNLYSDPNYQNLNHWSILQILARKGVPVESKDMPITETVLIQTNPLRINAHIAVIESLMTLYAKEIAAGDRVLNTVRRLNGNLPENCSFEKSWIAWVLNVCNALKQRIEAEVQAEKEQKATSRLQVPNIPAVRDFQDLCDGICLAYVISYYCPKELPWTNVRINYLPTIEDSRYNLSLVKSFCEKHLPYNIFHMTLDDITYMRGSMKLGLIVFLSDLYNLFEIHPAKCVSQYGVTSPEVACSINNMNANEHGVLYRRGAIATQAVVPIPDLRSEAEVAGSPSNRPPFQVSGYSSPRTTTTKLVAPIDHSVTEANNSDCHDSEAFVVHKSRGVMTLSSIHSQQQEDHMAPVRLRQPKDKAIMESKEEERGDFVAAGRPSNWEQNRRPSYAGRRSRRNSSSEESQLTIENFGGSQDQLNTIGRVERELDRKITNFNIEPVVPVRSSLADARGTLRLSYDTDSGSEKQDRESEKVAIKRQSSSDNITLASASPDVTNTRSNLPQRQNSVGRESLNESSKSSPYDRDTTRRPPNSSYAPTTSSNWGNNNDLYEEEIRSLESTSRLSNICMKLEEKRRRIEQEKRKIELALLQHQEQLHDDGMMSDRYKWDSGNKEGKEIDQADLEKYHQSITIMNLNLQDIQRDIQRLVAQQNQIQEQQLQAQQLMQAQKLNNILNQQQSFGSQQHLADSQHRAFGSTPHLPQALHNIQVNAFSSRPPSRDPYQHVPMMPTQYIDEHGQYMQSMPQQTQNMPHSSMQSRLQYPYPQYMSRQSTFDDYVQIPYNRQLNSFQQMPSQQQPYQRQTWAHINYDQQPIVDSSGWQGHKTPSEVDSYSTWGKHPHSDLSSQQGYVMYQNGSSGRSGGDYQQQYYRVNSPPQHSKRSSEDEIQWQRQITDSSSPNAGISDLSSSPVARQNIEDVMAPQSICFIGDEEDVAELEQNIIQSMQAVNISNYGEQQPQRMHSGRGSSSEDYESGEMLVNKLTTNISSGNLTYRIPSPSRPAVNANSFQNPREEKLNEKGFYISFDNEQPKRPKPPLRTKRSPKKEKTSDDVDHQAVNNKKRESLSKLHNVSVSEDVKSDTNNLRHNSSPYNYEDRNAEVNQGTYNKYTDTPIHRHQFSLTSTNNNEASPIDRKHLGDVTNHQKSSPVSLAAMSNPMSNAVSNHNERNSEAQNKAMVIGTDVSTLDPDSIDEMERRKEKIMLLSLQRRQQQEEAKARKEFEISERREKEREKEEEKARKKEEQLARRAAILEQHRLKKAIEEAEREGKTLERQAKPHTQSSSTPRLRQQRNLRQRPKTIHVDDSSVDLSETSSISSRGKKGSNSNLTGYGQLSSGSIKRDYHRGSQDSLAVKESPDEFPSTSSTPIGRRGSYKTSREQPERGRPTSRLTATKGNTLNFRGRKSNSLINLCDTDSGLGRATPPRRAPSPGMISSGRHLPSPSGPGSLPPGLIAKRRGFDDGSSDFSLIPSSTLEYSGPKLYKQPAAKSNRGIILNAVEYCVFPGAVNREAKQKVLEKIARSEAKHFLVLFRDAGCQFRALYSYIPETDLVSKLYGTGPSQVDEVMFDKFFKYNSGGKCFSEVHTKHLTVTIDAFTIHNSLWQGKKVHLPSKKDMALVI